MPIALAYGLLVLVALPFVGSCAAAVIRTNARNGAAVLAGLITLAGFLLAIAMFPTVSGGGIVRFVVPWAPELGLTFNLRLDGFAWVLTLLITGIGFLVVLYARYYMSAEDPVARFYSFLMAFMGAMLGVVLSGNLIQLVFFWELTSLFSFLLIGYWHKNAQAREAARMALIVTATGGLCLFAGIVLLGHIVGSYDLDRVLAAAPVIRSHSLYLPTLVLILIGAMTKSAQFPFHFWLPQAMAAPTPVSAYLHSATLVKGGVFLLVRLWPALGGTDEWLWLVASTGLITFVLGAYAALFQHDLKGLLAFSTISHLGLITLLIGLDSPLGQVAAIFHLVNHATFKASLFMAAGIIDHESGTRDLRRLSGLWSFMPITATLAMVAAAAMGGVPLLNGFLSKEMFFAETIEIHDNSFVDNALPYIVTVASMFTVAYSLRFIREVFFGPPPQSLPRVPHEPPFLMRFPSALLVLVCLVVGIAPSLTIGPILHIALHAVLGANIPPYNLAVWHGFTPELLMSAVAMCGGITLYGLLRTYIQASDGAPLLRYLSGRRVFEWLLVTLLRGGSRRMESFWGTRRLQPQLQLLVLAAILAGALPVLSRGLGYSLAWDNFDVSFGLIWAVGMTCALAAAYLGKFHRFAALIVLGGAGLITCVSFIWLSAPDLALTQLLVETVTTVLLLLGLRWLPKRIENIEASTSSYIRWYRVRDFSIAVAAGAGLAILAFAIMTRPQNESISRYFVENAYTKGGGTNIVNVILVDFRAFDTLGEITVLGIVALAVFALLRRFRPAAESIPVPEQQRPQGTLDPSSPIVQPDAERAAVIPALMMSLLFPVIGAAAAFLLFRGHDLPGGGFAAGLTMAISFILQYMAYGAEWVEARLRILPVRWMGTGLLLSLGVGAGAWFFNKPFLTSFFTYQDIPLIGSIPVSSALVFDVGVFAMVVGATILMLIAIAHQSVRSHRVPGGQRPGPGRLPALEKQ